MEFPLQIIITLDAVYWTKTTEENYLSSINSETNPGDLDEWFDVNVQMLDELTTLIRGDLTDL